MHDGGYCSDVSATGPRSFQSHLRIFLADRRLTESVNLDPISFPSTILSFESSIDILPCLSFSLSLRGINLSIYHVFVFGADAYLISKYC